MQEYAYVFSILCMHVCVTCYIYAPWILSAGRCDTNVDSFSRTVRIPKYENITLLQDYGAYGLMFNIENKVCASALNADLRSHASVKRILWHSCTAPRALHRFWSVDFKFALAKALRKHLTHTCIQNHTNTYVHTCINAHECVCVYIYMYIYIDLLCTFVHACMCGNMHLNMYT